MIENQIKNSLADQSSPFQFEEILTEVLIQIKGEEAGQQMITREVDIRYEEYNYFLSGNDDVDGDLVLDTKDLTEYEGRSFILEHFDSIVLIKKLKETRAFYGFSRINPYDGKTIEESKNYACSKRCFSQLVTCYSSFW